MQRYFVEKDQIQGQYIRIKGEDAHHISRVMRMKKGTTIICNDYDGHSALCEIEEITSGEVLVHVIKWMDEAHELPVSVTIAQGLPKGDKLETIIQKGTELGAKKFLPFFASRSIVKWDEKKGRKKTERFKKIAKEAAEQSHRNIIPEIIPPVSFKELNQQIVDYDIVLIAYEEEAKAGAKSQLAHQLKKLKPGNSVLLVVGPEGGLSEEEVDFLIANGGQTCSLGPRILRTETAPLYFLSVISYQTELLE